MAIASSLVSARVGLPRHPAVEVRASACMHRGRVFDVVRESLRLPSGTVQELDIVDHPGAVAIAAMREDGALWLVRQYRHAVGDWLVEVPAGRIERGEEPLAAAKRELEEETGFRAADWERVREFFPAPGFASERMILFLARELELAESRKAHDADEELELVAMHPEEMLSGDVRDAKSLIAAMLLERRARGISDPAPRPLQDR